nr:hypothetical protein BaRGS_029456 [Batillaria attramentaria]
MTAPEGNFTSPAFPYQYPPSSYCVWTITVAPSDKIELTFEEFNVGYLSSGNRFCDGAHIRLYDSDKVDANRVIDTYRYPWPELPVYGMVVCAYCAYIDDTDSAGGIYYHLYEDKGATDTEDAAVLKKATEDVQKFSPSHDFRATVALVVTWDRVKQGRYSNVAFTPDQKDGEATFQLALISNGQTSYVLVYYLTGSMTWEYRGHWYYVIIGASDGERENYQLNMYSKTRNAYKIDEVFGNTGPIESRDGKQANATVFTAFGAEENGTRVYVGLHPLDKSSLEIYGEERDYSKDFEVQGENFTVDADNFTMFRDNNSIVVAFPSGAVKDDTTVLRYPPRMGPANYSHPDFVPVFLDEVPKEEKDAAEALCGEGNSACIYDYFSTGSEDFASTTTRTGEQAVKENVQIKNTLPKVEVPDYVTVRSGQPAKFNVTADDPDENDEVTYALVDEFGGYELAEDGLSCVDQDECEDGNRICPQKGWTGSNCKNDVNECEENPDVCGKDLVCINNEGSYSCDCRSGFEKKGDGDCTGWLDRLGSVVYEGHAVTPPSSVGDMARVFTQPLPMTLDNQTGTTDVKVAGMPVGMVEGEGRVVVVVVLVG